MTDRHLFGYPKVGRFGLGHSLLAWARCVVWCNKNNAQMIAPQWLQPRLGPYIRRERDKRFYYSQFRRGEQIGGLKRLYLLATARRLNIADWKNSDLDRTSTIVLFENLPTKNEVTYLHEIMGHSRLVHSALLDMTVQSLVPKRPSMDHVAIHVRGGDFSIVNDPSQYLKGTHNLRLPIQWYCEMLIDLRRKLNARFPAIIYSDCSDQEISALLSLSDVKRAPKAAAVTDLLSMAQAPMLISSGSNFSRWASYLGQIPRICYPGQRSYRMLENHTDVELEPECENEIPLDFISHFLHLGL